MLNHFCLSDSLQPYDLQPARLLCPWDSPDKNIGFNSECSGEPLKGFELQEEHYLI